MKKFTTTDFKVASVLMTIGREYVFKMEGASVSVKFEYTGDINETISDFFDGSLRLDPYQIYANHEKINAFRKDQWRKRPDRD